ncbi:hypothetical protein RchiOBHm_Chr5g0005881 [Rosa chinensis]|uniref:Uncharacterized protein n=1 Tax=Rosa chinensis TaxID=74649 RepID=A0A2P6Q3E4_ROSCH|nr:hypothetical protein RchiOBHm_Chr5g0005881 [Rosa chinensis]
MRKIFRRPIRIESTLHSVGATALEAKRVANDSDQEVSKPGESDSGKSEADSSGEKREATPST